MKYLGDSFDLGAESQDEAAPSSAALNAQLSAVQDRLRGSVMRDSGLRRSKRHELCFSPEKQTRWWR